MYRMVRDLGHAPNVVEDAGCEFPQGIGHRHDSSLDPTTRDLVPIVVYGVYTDRDDAGMLHFIIFKRDCDDRHYVTSWANF